MNPNGKKQLKQIAKRIIKIQSKLNLGTSILTPINLLSERENFFNSDSYNPVFTYQASKIEVTDDEIEDLISEINQLVIETELKAYFLNVLTKTKILKKAILAIGTDNFAAFSNQLFNISQADIDRHLDMVPDLEFKKIDHQQLMQAAEIKAHFEKIILEVYGLDQVKILLDEYNPFTVRVSNKKVVIGRSIKRFSGNVERLTVHELESHVLRRQSLLQTKNIFHRICAFDQSILFSEGLAVYNEVTTGAITETAMNTYLHRLQAVDKINLSFREIYTYLVNFMNQKIAFVMTYRVKRGMSDTSKPGGYKKDAYYLMGYFRVKEFIDKGGDIKDLYRFAVPELVTLLRKYNLASSKFTILPRFLLKEDLLTQELL